MKPRVVIIGAGNVATHLAKALSKSVVILQIFSRNKENADALASQLAETPITTDNIDDIVSEADIYIVSIKDDAIKPLVDKIKANTALWVHTSGSVPMTVFSDKMKRYGVLYPLQTFSRDVDVDISEVPFFIEGSDVDAQKEISDLARLMSENIKIADSEQRRRIHVAAVFACNFSNHLWAIAEKILQEGGFDFDVLLPLLRVTLDKAGKISPAEGQTGPARRGDTGTMSRHLELLDSDTAEIYRLLSQNIMKQYNII